LVKLRGCCASSSAMSLGQYEDVSVLSGGSCSRVDLVKDKATSQNFVRKTVNTEGLDPRTLKLLRTEVELLRDLEHPNVMGLHEYMEDTDASQFVTILEYIPGNDCTHLLKHQQGPLDESVAASIISQVLCALSYCHANNCIHRDVKPDNVMLTPDCKCGYHATLIDFGSAARGKEGGIQDAAGTHAYMAPDMLVGSPKYDAKVDVWSCGAFAFEMLTGKPPFGHAADYEGDTKQLCRKIRSYKRSADPEAELASSSQWKGLSEEARDFLRKTLAADPDARPTAVEAAAHQWFALHNGRATARRSRSMGGA